MRGAADICPDAGNDLAVWTERTIFAAVDESYGNGRVTIIRHDVKLRYTI